MATIKSYTDLEQSKKLAEFLPLETADMCYPKDAFEYHYAKEPVCHYSGIGLAHPCWSLAALLGVLPKTGADEPMVRKMYYASEPKERYICEYNIANITSEYDNPVDACVAMIERLHELNLL